jgi:hypothetical protein
MQNSFSHAPNISQNPIITAHETAHHLFATYNPRLIFDKGRPGITIPPLEVVAPAAADDVRLLSACSDIAASISSSMDSTAAR